MASRRDHALLGDIGATNARFALLSDGVLGPPEWLAVRDYPSFATAVEAFLGRHRDIRVKRALLAVAGAVEANRSFLINSGWTVDGEELARIFGLASVRIVNDFEAVAWSLPHLKEAQLRALGGGQALPGAPQAVLGPGTGLGVACLIPHGGDVVVLPTEGGHSTLPSMSRREDAVIDYLRGRFGHVSAERAISGQGLENLHAAIAAIDKRDVPERDAATITRSALDGSCPICSDALDMFCAMLGTIAGNVALSFGARGGVFIAGGITPRVIEHLARSQFRARFESKGRFSDYLVGIPTRVIMYPDASFLGLEGLVERAED